MPVPSKRALPRKPTPKTSSSRVDAAIARVAPFAQPILAHLRAVVHEAVPEVTEDIKWGRPFFLVDGEIVCNMAAFKHHCTFGFWSPEMTALLDAEGSLSAEGGGSFGKVTTVADLPPRKTLVGYVRKAASLLQSRKATNPIAARTRKMSKPAIAMPQDFASALARSKNAAAMFDGFSPSCRREYLEWITTAKRDETRKKRIVDAVKEIAAGKTRNWKYK